MRYIYGPVKSRRLGMSLGLSLAPYKACNFDCVYCQLGKTPELIAERNDSPRAEEVIGELRSWLQNNPEEAKGLNYITIAGSGEPTLNSNIGALIRAIKELAPVPVAVITNASLMDNPDLRRELLAADLLVPSLDAVIPEVFKKVNRPHSSIDVNRIIEGLVSLRREFRGKIWLEVMLVSGVNDDIRYIKKLKAVVERINPDKIQLNIPVRTTAEPGIMPPDKKKLEKIKEILGEKCEICF